MSVFRSPLNPIIKPSDIKPFWPGHEVICAFNAGVARFGDEVLLLLRIAERPVNNNPEVYLSPIYDIGKKTITVKEFNKKDPMYDFSDSRVIKAGDTIFLTSLSYLRIARSKDGIHFSVDEQPALLPENEYEVFGIEDPRITKINDTYYINYVAAAPTGVTTCLSSTRDFKTYTRYGVIFCPDNKDVEIFPEKINGKYYALHRPSSGAFKRNDIWIAESPDLLNWGGHRLLMGTRQDCWDEGRIGGSVVPFKIKEGWLEIYHGATRDDRYCLGAVLLDENEPWKIIARSRLPILEPEEDYEVNGFFGNVIFSCGALYENGKVKIYYGAADTYTCYAEISIENILENLKEQK